MISPNAMPIDFLAQQTRPLPAAPTARQTSQQAIDRTAREFESMTLQQMLSFMMSQIDLSDGPFGGGMGERAFQPFLVEEYAKGFSAAGGIGIADAVRAEMLKIQEAANGGRAQGS
jgi:Rod binding domain-containing protein